MQVFVSHTQCDDSPLPEECLEEARLALSFVLNDLGAAIPSWLTRNQVIEQAREDIQTLTDHLMVYGNRWSHN